MSRLRQSNSFESAATVKFFLEADSVDKDNGLIKAEMDKSEIINKVGHALTHALHLLNPVFRDFSH